MLNQISNKFRSIAEIRNNDGSKSISKNQLINRITTGDLSPTSRRVFKTEEHIAKLSKREKKTLYVIVTGYNYGYLSSKNKDGIYRVLSKRTTNKKYMISKYHQQNQLISTCETVKRLEPIKKSQTDVKGSINRYETEKSNDAFDDTYIECKSNGIEDTSIKDYVKTIRPYLGDMINRLKESYELEIQLTMNINFMSRKDNDNTINVFKK